MASSSRKTTNLFDDDETDSRFKRKNFEIKINNIPEINKFILVLTSEKMNDIINTFIQTLDGLNDISVLQEKLDKIYSKCPPLMHNNLKYELYYDQEQLLQKYYFVFLSLLIKKHYASIRINNDLNNINILLLLRLIENNNIFANFESINHNELNYSSYFSLISTYLIAIISHQTITTQDICLLSSILQDNIINKNISNWPVFKDFIELFRNIVHVDFVKNLYMELINDEIGSTNSVNYFVFTETIDKTIEEILEKRGVSFANLSTCYSAVTCFNRTLVINKNIIILSSIIHCIKLTDNIIMFAGLLIIFIHEFFHILRRTMIREAGNPFYQKTPLRKIASRDDTCVTDGGTQLEDRLFGEILESIGYLDGKYLLQYENWNDNNHENFKKSLNIKQNEDSLVNGKNNRWIIPSRGCFIHISSNGEENKNDYTETPAITTTSSSQRLTIPQCVLASSFYHIDN